MRAKILVGKGLLLAGVALVVFAFCGGAAHGLPQYTVYYATGGTGIVTITAGFLAGALPLDS